MKALEQLPQGIYKHITVSADGCWLYSGKLRGGYGWTTWNRTSRYVHRLVFSLLVAPIEDGMTIDHLCRNRACCRPAHLEQVSRAENTRRSFVLDVEDGMLPLRTTRRSTPRKTSCVHGHRFEAHWPRDKDDAQVCISCYNLRKGFPIDRPYSPRGNRRMCVAGLHEWTEENRQRSGRSGYDRCSKCREISRQRAAQRAAAT